MREPTTTWCATWGNAMRVACVYADLFRGQRFRVSRGREPYAGKVAWAVREVPARAGESCS